MAGESRQQVASVCQSLLSAVNQLEGQGQSVFGMLLDK